MRSRSRQTLQLLKVALTDDGSRPHVLALLVEHSDTLLFDLATSWVAVDVALQFCIFSAVSGNYTMVLPHHLDVHRPTAVDLVSTLADFLSSFSLVPC